MPFDILRQIEMLQLELRYCRTPSSIKLDGVKPQISYYLQNISSANAIIGALPNPPWERLVERGSVLGFQGDGVLGALSDDFQYAQTLFTGYQDICC